MRSRRAIWQSRIIDGATAALLIAAALLFLDARRGGAQSQALGAPPTLERDSRVPAVEVIQSDGTRAALLGPPAEHGHLILFFRTDCPVCTQQRPAWVELAARARAGGWQVTGVTTEPLTEAAKGYLGSGLRVVQMADVSGAERLRVTVVPTTLAVSGAHAVLLHHPGLLSAAVTDSVARFF